MASSNFPRTAFGYEIKVVAHANDYELTVPSFPNITARSQSLGRAIRDVWPKVQAELDQLEAAGKPAPATHLWGAHHDKVAKRLSIVNRTFLQYGFFASGDLTLPELVDAEKVAETLRKQYSTPPSDPNARKVIENLIFASLKGVVIGNHLRAANVAGLWMKVPTLQKFSHFIESANLLYYQSEYIPLVLTLSPVIEGVLLNWFGYDYTKDSMPDESKLLNFMVEQFPPNPKGNHPLIWEEYVRAFAYIYENIFRGTHKTAHDDQFFNRHYVAHGMGEGWFYQRNNVCKLTMLADLLAHIVADSTGFHDRFNVTRQETEPHEKTYEKILNFYLQMSLGEQDLLKKHSHFKGTV